MPTERTIGMWHRLVRCTWLLAALAGTSAVSAQAAPETGQPSPSRQQELVHVVRQDCGSCHGMKLTGGLGSPLTPERMRELPIDTLVATILHGRPGTPMPGWQTMLTESDARWIATQLQRGFPQESRP